MYPVICEEFHFHPGIAYVRSKPGWCIDAFQADYDPTGWGLFHWTNDTVALLSRGKAFWCGGVVGGRAPEAPSC